MNPGKMWQDIDEALAKGGAETLPPDPIPAQINDQPRSGLAPAGWTAERYDADAVSTKRRARLELLIPLRHGHEWASGIAAHVLHTVKAHVEQYEGGEVTRSKDGRFLHVVCYWPHAGPLPEGEPPWFSEHVRLPAQSRRWPGVRAALTYQRAVPE